MSLIYRITNLVNGKVYIGQTIKKVEKRLAEHMCAGKYSIGHALNKYGENNFSCDIITEGHFNPDLLDELERHYIRLYNSMNRNKGYNLESGGRRGKKVSPKSIENFKKSSKKAWESLSETEKSLKIKRLRDTRNKNCTEEEIARRISLAHKGKYLGWDSHFNKPILQMLKDRTPIRLWSCAEETQNYGYGSTGVRDVCYGRKGRKTQKGYLWRFATKEDIIKYDHLKNIPPTKVEKMELNKTVIQKDSEGNIIKEWDNSKRISENYNIKPNKVSYIIKYNKTFDNSTFEFKKH